VRLVAINVVNLQVLGVVWEKCLSNKAVDGIVATRDLCPHIAFRFTPKGLLGSVVKRLSD
jgi:hypothetical protein